MLVTTLDRGLVGRRPKHSRWLSTGDFPFLFGFPMYAVLVAQSCPTLYLFTTSWNVARQTLLSMGFSRQEY